MDLSISYLSGKIKLTFTNLCHQKLETASSAESPGSTLDGVNRLVLVLNLFKTLVMVILVSTEHSECFCPVCV